MSLAANAITTKAKAMFGKRLKEEDYVELCRKTSVSEVVSYLKNETGYHDSLKDVHESSVHRGQLEEFLAQAIFERGIELIRYAPLKQKKFYYFKVQEYEIELILKKVRYHHANMNVEFIQSVPLYLQKYMEIPLSKLIDAKNDIEIIESLKTTQYYKIIKACFEETKYLNYNKCENELKKYHYKSLHQIMESSFKRRTRKDLLVMLQTYIELSNIIKIYRAKQFFCVSKEEIKETLMPYMQRISKNVMEQMLNANTVEDFLKILATSPYKIFYDDKEYIYIEYYADKIRYYLSKRMMYYATDPALVFYAYNILMDLELQNIITIIEGVRYQVDPKKIEQMLII